MKITMIEPIGISKEQAEQVFGELLSQGHELVYCGEPLSIQEKLERAADAEILIVANTPLPGEVIRTAQKLKMIAVAFTGVDHIPMELCRERGITVCNAQGYCTHAVAELTFGLAIACMRQILACDTLTRTEKTKAGHIGNELYGKTFGIVGTGAIGSCVARIAGAFGCRVLGYSRSQRQEALEAGVEYTDLKDLLQRSDIVSLHVPLTAETRHLIDRENISCMKPGAVLINVARGDVVDSDALAEALNAGRLGAAGIDVFEQEPPVDAGHPLLHAKNTVVTPHVAFATKESMINRAEIVRDTIAAWISGNPVNVK